MNSEQNRKVVDSNNMRMTEINTYYGEQYKAYIEVLKIVVWFSLSVLILTILKNMSLLPDMVLNGLLGAVILGGLIYTLWLSYDISLRDSMNFSEYNFGFSKPKKSFFSYNEPKDDKSMKSLSDSLGIGCVGEECCSEGMTYNADLNKCIDSASSSSNYDSVVKASNDVGYPPCYGLTDESPSTIVKPDCLQKVWADSGCNKSGTVYPSDNYKGWWNDGTGAKTLGHIKSDMKAWGTLTDADHVKGCKGVNASSQETQWRCLSGITVPLRKNAGGDVECMSQNNQDCLWRGSDAECNLLLSNKPSDLKPLSCGGANKAQYDNPAHWCAKAKPQL